MIRKAVLNDSPRIAEIHVFASRWAYKEFISMDYLINQMTVKIREEKSNGILSEENNSNIKCVYEENGIIKGFIIFKYCCDQDKTNKTSELSLIYIDPFFQ